MPEISSQAIGLMASLAVIFVQVVKDALPEKIKPYIPVALVVALPLIRVGLCLYYGTDPVAGALEGIFGAGSAIGAYEAGHQLAPSVVTSRGWLTF